MRRVISLPGTLLALLFILSPTHDTIGIYAQVQTSPSCLHNTTSSSAPLSPGSQERLDTERRTLLFERFQAWLKEQGVEQRYVEPTMSTEDGHGITVRAKKDISKGSSFVSIPKRLIITLETVYASPLAEIVYGENVTLAFDKSALIWFLNYHQLQGDDTFWRPYLDILPKSFTNAIAWTEEEMNATESYAIGRMGRMANFHFEQEYALYCPKLINKYPHILPKEFCDRDQFMWAYQNVKTRSFSIRDQDGSLIEPSLEEQIPFPAPADFSMDNVNVGISNSPLSKSYLVPFADLVNHSPISQSTWTETGSGRFELVTQSEWKKGQEVFLFYCAGASNDQMLSSFGFVPENNTRDHHLGWDIFDGFFHPSEALRRYDYAQKIYLLNAVNLTSRYVNLNTSELPSRLLLARHILDLSARDIVGYGAMNGTHLLVQLMSLRVRLMQHLKSFRADFNHDREQLRDPHSDLNRHGTQVMKWIVQVRHNEHADWRSIYREVALYTHNLHLAYCDQDARDFGWRDIWLCHRGGRPRQGRGARSLASMRTGPTTRRSIHRPPSVPVVTVAMRRVYREAKAIKSVLFDME